MTPWREELFRSPELQVRRVATGDGRRVAITFDSYTDDRDLDRWAFGEPFFMGLGVTAIHVLSRGNDWYQYADMAEALEIVRQAASGAERCITYGSSMGGYAAIRFAERVGAHEALALQPQYSINPAVAAFDDRWRDDARRIRWRPELDGPIAGMPRAILVFDPFGVDARHADLIAREASVRPFRLRGGGHGIATVLNEMNLLRPLVEMTLEGTFDPQTFEKDVRRRRRQSPTWLSELSRIQPDWRPRTALSLARQALALSPEHPIPLRAVADAQARMGKLDEAVEIYAGLVARSPGKAMYLAPYSRLLARAGRLEEALEAAEGAIAADPTRASPRSWRARLLGRLGRYGPAVSEAREALKRSGGARPFQVQLLRLRWLAVRAWISRSIGRPEPRGR